MVVPAERSSTSLSVLPRVWMTDEHTCTSDLGAGMYLAFLFGSGSIEEQNTRDS